jgi:hypothetical protein
VLITARLEEVTVKELLDELLPAKVLLDDDGARWIQIDQARHIDFVAGEGLRVEAAGQLQWQAAGLPLGVTLTSAKLLVRPEIADDENGGRLVFKPSLEALDLKNVPSFVDTGVLALVNSRLEAEGDQLAWHFGKTLTHEFRLPPTIVPPEAFQLGAHGGIVEVLADAIVFSLTLKVAFRRLVPTG